MVSGRDLKLPSSKLRFIILCRSVGMDLALAPQRHFELIETNSRSSRLLQIHKISSLTCSLAL